MPPAPRPSSLPTRHFPARVEPSPLETLPEAASPPDNQSFLSHQKSSRGAKILKDRDPARHSRPPASEQLLAAKDLHYPPRYTPIAGRLRLGDRTECSARNARISRVKFNSSLRALVARWRKIHFGYFYTSILRYAQRPPIHKTTWRTWRTFDKCGNRNKLRFCANLAGNILNLADPADRGLSIWLSARFSRHQVAPGHRCDPRRGG